MKKYKDVTWFCDECDAELNRQSGFDDIHKTWTCQNCGHINYIDDDNIVDDAMARAINYIASVCCCKVCVGHHRKEVINGLYYCVCEDCGDMVQIDESI